MKKNFTLLLILLVNCFYQSNATVIYVSETAGGSNNGTSWTDAFTSLQSGIAASSTGDQIWIAAGTYKPINVTNPSVNDRMVSFVLPNGVSIYGGFAGNETQLSQRDWVV